MGKQVSTQRGNVRVIFGSGTASRVAQEIQALGAKKAVVICSPRAAADAARFGLPVLPLAKEHVPVEVATEAKKKVDELGADLVIAYGGGSAIGVAKAVALLGDGKPRVAAIPTTYSGSEMTSLYGITENGAKRTGKDERVRPVLVIYDPELLAGLAKDVAVASMWNAIAHAAEVLWTPGIDPGAALTAEEALRLLARAVLRPDDRETALEGAYLAGLVVGDVGTGLHHKLCHILGGFFAMPHAATHAALLPHVAAVMPPQAAIARALGALDGASGLRRLAQDTGVLVSLASLGMPADGVARVVAAVPVPLQATAQAALQSALAAPKVRSAAPLRGPAEIPTQPGFASTHESEALPGALPRTQNAPRICPYGLLPELLNGTPFTVKNAQNSRVWLYRVRASFSHAPFTKLAAPNFSAPLGDVEPNRARWAPLPIPDAPAQVDFIDGMVLLGGAGSAADSPAPGYSIYLYAANADMADRAYSSADGDILIVPQEGTLECRTELGWLRVPVGSFAVIPRAIKFSIGVPDGKARGWMAEVTGPRFRLPERGPIGSNGLADARHFLAPTASYEDRLCPDGYEIVHKLGGHLYSAVQDHSPFDVVAWHGIHVPFVYDLMMFNAMGSVTFDHQDPSIHTVMTAPFDDHGRAVVDFVVFRGRWDVLEHSFRPPFMHRNAASEINGVVRVASVDGGYAPGVTFVSPLLTAHGVATSTYDHVLGLTDEQAEGPRRLSDESLWIMFESAMPFRASAWASATPHRDAAFLSQFEGMKKRFDPSKR